MSYAKANCSGAGRRCKREVSMSRALVMGLLGLGLAAAAQAEYAVGQTPPNFSGTDWNGNPWSLYAQRGKVVMINFGATW